MTPSGVELSPEMAATLANAVSLHFTKRYPADNLFPVSAKSGSILLIDTRRGRRFTFYVEHSTLSRALLDLKLHNKEALRYLQEIKDRRLRKHLSWRFYDALGHLYVALQRRLDESQREG